MSTFRIARHGVDMDTGAVGVDRRGVVVVIFLCVALFVGCFALGRAASPRGRSGAQSPQGLPVAFAGAEVPLRLSSAPAIQLRTAAPTRSAARSPESRSAVVANTRAVAPTPTPVAPRVQSPVREVASAPAPVRPAQPAPASTRTSESSKSSQPHTSSGSGTSFDSSG
jgi:hypothetical protein